MVNECINPIPHSRGCDRRSIFKRSLNFVFSFSFIGCHAIRFHHFTNNWEENSWIYTFPKTSNNQPHLRFEIFFKWLLIVDDPYSFETYWRLLNALQIVFFAYPYSFQSYWRLSNAPTDSIFRWSLLFQKLLKIIECSTDSIFHVSLLFPSYWKFVTLPLLSGEREIKGHQEDVYYHHHHHVVPPARISLTLSRHFSLSFIASGRSSGLHPVSSHSCCM